MIIKSIEIENFRQYKGINKLEFSVDPEKNVTIILGINTSGKTTLIQAFNWCLYGMTSFKSKEMLLNSEMASSLPYNGYALVRVKIVLVHENKEFTISRSQKFYRMDEGRVRSDKPYLSVSYKEPNGNSFPITEIECSNTINKILPEGLSDYFFFDGERIQEINNKKDVVSAVRGLMGLDVTKAAVDHLNPTSSSSVISRMRNDLNIGSDDQSRKLRYQLETKTKEIETYRARLDTINAEIEYAKSEKARLADLLRSTSEVREAQKRRDEIEKNLSILAEMIVSAQERIVSDFNKDYFSFFIQPIVNRIKSVLAGSTKQLEGIPEMDSKAIDYILKRGRCICGCDLTKNQGAVECIEYEQSLLPPKQIGTLIRSFNETCDMITSQCRNNKFFETIYSDYAEMRRLDRRKGELLDELKIESDNIKKLGSVSAIQIEEDYLANEQTLENKMRQRGACEQAIRQTQAVLDDIIKQMNSLALQCDKNALLRREIAYATAVYQWFRESYDKQEKEVKTALLESVNRIFNKMYHGSRQVTIDDNYRIQLITSIGDERISTDESKGLEAVKNFSFISGLVDLARKKARSQQLSAFSDEPDVFSTEPYPIVMDAPFSNVDEIHIKNISSILPEIAEQVILIVMNKDWAYAKPTMGDKVGASYIIEKVNNSDTYSTIRRND